MPRASYMACMTTDDVVFPYHSPISSNLHVSSYQVTDSHEGVFTSFITQRSLPRAPPSRKLPKGTVLKAPIALLYLEEMLGNNAEAQG